MRPLTLLLLASVAFGQDFRTSISLVRVDTEVIAEDGRLIGDLTQQSFRVFDNNKEQTILNFASSEEPLDLILLFDISGSMKTAVEKVSAAAHEGFKALQPGDRVSVMVFNSRSRVVLPFTEDLEQVERSIKEDVLGQPFGGSTEILTSVDDAALRFLHERRTRRRRVVLIVTDNLGDHDAGKREQPVVRDFWEADAILTGLIVPNPAWKTLRVATVIMAPQTLLFIGGMTGIAAKTGGDSLRSNDPGTAFQEAMRRIRTRYALYYKMPGDKPGKTRKIRVQLAPEAAKQHKNARIRARTGYVVPDVSAAPTIEDRPLP